MRRENWFCESCVRDCCSCFAGALQAATQIQDHAIAFVPKLVAVVAVLLVSGPLLGAQLARFTEALLAAIPMIR